MKLRLAPLALVLVVLLSGCAAMLERSYVSSTAHVSTLRSNEDSSVLRAESYRGLVDAICISSMNTPGREPSGCITIPQM